MLARIVGALAVLGGGYLAIALLSSLVAGMSGGLLIEGIQTLLELLLLVGLVVPPGLALLILVPPLGRWVLDRVPGAASGRGLTQDERGSLTKDERSVLRYLRRPEHWAEPAGVSVTRDVKTLYPRVLTAELTPFGPAVIVQPVRGTVPSIFGDESMSAAVNAPIRCEVIGPNQLRLQAVTRDPLAATTTATAPGTGDWLAAPSEADDWADDWDAAINGEAKSGSPS